MSSNGKNQSSPARPPESLLTIGEIQSLHETRLPIIAKLPPRSQSANARAKLVGSDPQNDIPPPRPLPQSVFVYRRAVIILSIYLGAGTLCFYLVRRHLSGKKTNGVLDALYFTIVLMTSVGYGDLSPDTTPSILLATLFAILGMLLIVLVLSKAAEYFVQKQELWLESVSNMRQTADTTEVLKQVEDSKKERNKCILLVVLLVVLMVVGTAVMVSVEDLDLIHAFYCIIATSTSVGSDKCFSTTGGRVFALFWIVVGTIYLGQVLFTFTEIFTQRRRRALMKWVLHRKMTVKELISADLDDDGVLMASEFVIYKLKEMGKISDEDIAPILEEFNGLECTGDDV